ncbi:MAG: ATP-binding cassette domain-containing protein [Deltaproteobacteria bacterium]
MIQGTLLELDRVDMVFGGLRAVSGVSLEVPARSIFGLIGPNGAGKTTVFNCITGVYAPTAGGITFAGERIDGLQAYQIADRGVARTFQNIRLFGAMTVLENVLVASHRTSKASLVDSMLRTKRYLADEQAMRKKAEELLDIFGLKRFADDRSSALSYGDQRRLEIARALMLAPRLLLLDEPAAGMNSSEADVLKKQIVELRDRFDLTVLLVEHNMQVVMNVCETIHVMDRGETIAHGTADAVKSHPRVLEAYLGKGSQARTTVEGGEAVTPEEGDDAKKKDAPGVLLSVENLRVNYGGIHAVKGVSLEVRRGELVAMIGANGAGKTSTLKALARLLPSSGRIVFDGRDVGALPPHMLTRMGVAMAPEGRAIFPNLTVRENLDMGAYTEPDAAQIAKRMDEAVTLFPRLGERMKQLGGTLSGGEQQMLAIARALMSGPKLLMLDEPSLGIAPVLVDQIYEGIEKIRRTGTTILLVEQNTRRALGAAQRAYVLVTGEIVLSGRAIELAEDPRVKDAYLGEAVHAAE